MGTITVPFRNIAISHPSLHLVVSPQRASSWLGKQSARVHEELLPSKVNSFPDLCLRRAMCISEVQTTSAPVTWALLTSKQVYVRIPSVAGSSALPSTALVSLGYSSLPNKCYDLGTITKEVSWYTITFISKLCVKKMKSSKISVCLQEGTHPYCFLMILLLFPVHQKTVFAKLWDFRNIYFVHKSKQLQSLNSWWLNSLFCLLGGEFSKIICVRMEWQTCPRVLRAYNLSVQHDDKPQPWFMSLAIYSMEHVLNHYWVQSRAPDSFIDKMAHSSA